MDHFCEIVPVGAHPTLVRLGRLDPWFRVEPWEGRLGGSFYPDWPKLQAGGCSDFVRRMIEIHKGAHEGRQHVTGHVPLLWADAMAASLCDGPKLFRPTVEQFDSMRHVDCRVTADEFRLPFPALLVVVPRELRRHLAEEFGFAAADAPTWALLRQRVRCDMGLFLGVKFCRKSIAEGGAMQDFTYFIFPGERISLEDLLARRIDGTPDHDPAWRASVILCRVALNLCLMMTHYGTAPPVPLHPDDYAKHRRRAHLERFKHGDFLAVNMRQHVVVRRELVETVAAEPGAPTGREVRPHWRRGHWRREQGFRDVVIAGGTPKLSFVRPCLVRRDRVADDVSKSTAVYEAKN